MSAPGLPARRAVQITTLTPLRAAPPATDVGRRDDLAAARRGARPGPHSDRLRLAGSIATSVALLTVVHQHGDWLEVSSDFWSVAVGLVSGCALIALWRGRWLPTTAGEQTVWLRRLSAAVSFGLAATLVGIMAA